MKTLDSLEALFLLCLTFVLGWGLVHILVGR
jgi:hypothetical protein